MAADRRSTWRLLPALLLLVTVPAAGSIPALPPPAPKADLVSAELLDDIASLDQAEILVLVAFVVPEELPAWTDPHRKTRVWDSNLASEAQPIGEPWFKGEIAVGVLVVRFYHADGLGSVRVLTDEAGSVTDRYSFSAFGELLEHGGDDENAYLFAGEPLDPNSGFYYNRARWMDPGVGRFVSVDPFGGRSGDPGSLHRYTYAHLRPADRTDPSGLFSTGTVGFAVSSAIVGVLAGITFLQVHGAPGGNTQLPDLGRARVMTHSVQIRGPRASTEEIFQRLASLQGVNRSGVGVVRGTPVNRVGQRIGFAIFPRIALLGRPPFGVEITKFSNENGSGFFSGVTLEGHPLAGARFWRLFALPNGDLVVQTGALEHDRGWLDAGLSVVGGGRSKQFAMWRVVIEDIARFSGGSVVEDGAFYEPYGREAEEFRSEFERLLF